MTECPTCGAEFDNGRDFVDHVLAVHLPALPPQPDPPKASRLSTTEACELASLGISPSPGL